MVSGDIRYLIKDAVAAWLSSVTAPVRAEVVALNDWSGRGPEYERLFTIVAHGAHWITALIQHGVIDRLIEGGDATSAQAFSAMKAGAADHAAEVAAYLRNWWGFQPTKTSRLLDWFDRLHLTSPVEPLVSLYLELIGAAPDQYLVSVFEHQFQLAGWVHRNQYDAGARVLGAWLTRWMRQFPNEHPFGPDRGGSQRYWIRKLAEGSPGEFIAAVWQPFVEGIERDRLGLESRRLQFATIRLDDEDGWLAMVGDALSSLAAAEPLRAEGLLRELSNQSKPALWLQLRAIAGDGSVLAQLLPSLIDAPDLFELGDHRDGWRSMADASRASLGHLPEIERGRIEDRIRRYRPEVEIARDAASGHDPQQQQRALRWLARSGEVERAILATIGAANLSPVARSRLEELERKFHGRPLPESGVRGGLVRSPIGLEKAERMSDEQWLNAVARYSDDDEHVYLHNSVVGGAAQLAVTLRALTKAQPARFVGLMERFEQESNLAYVRAVLAGLRESEINDDSESLGVRAFRAVQRWDIEQLRREICWLVEAIPEMGRDPTVFELLLNIAQHGDADDDNVTLSNGGRANDVYHLLHANEDFEANGINGDRGVAWLALAEVLWIDATRLQVIEATLLSRIHAPEEITSVRTCMCQAANSIVKHDVVRGLSILRSLAERDLVAVTTARGRHLLRWAIYNQPAEVQQVVEQLTSANSERVRAVGLWLEAMQALTDLLREKSFATTMVEDELRRRVAGFVAAHNVLSGTVGERAESWLRLLFYDDHASVRQEAARVMWDDMLAPDLGRLEFAFAYLHSPTFVEEPDQLMMAIGKRVDSVPQLARAAVTRVLGLRDEWTTSGHYSFAMHDLGKMLVALYRTCEGDAAAEREVLDLFDTYLMADLRDLQTDIREYERL